MSLKRLAAAYQFSAVIAFFSQGLIVPLSSLFHRTCISLGVSPALLAAKLNTGYLVAGVIVIPSLPDACHFMDVSDNT